MHLPKVRPPLPGRVLAAALLALLTACQPTGAERLPAEAGAGSRASAPTAKTSPPARPEPVRTPASGAIPGKVSLAVGEELPIAAGTRLRLLRIVTDSRCPKDAQCIWAGEVSLEFEVSTGQGKARFELSQATKPRETAKGLDFELVGFGPCPPGQGRMADAECASVAMSTPAER